MWYVYEKMLCHLYDHWTFYFEVGNIMRDDAVQAQILTPTGMRFCS
jgi:hypothetical protein